MKAGKFNFELLFVIGLRFIRLVLLDIKESEPDESDGNTVIKPDGPALTLKRYFGKLSFHEYSAQIKKYFLS